MANVENLNFGIIVDDKQFNDTIQKVEQRAQQFNTTVGKLLAVGPSELQNTKEQNKILFENAKNQEKIAREALKTANAQNKVNEALRKAQAINNSEISTKRALDKEREAQATIKTATAQERLNQLTMNGHKSLSATSRIMQEIKNYTMGILTLAGATNIVRNMVRISAEFELQKTTLRAILQDTQGADRIFSRIKDLAVQSPFAFKELATYVKQLSAYSIPMEQLYDTTKMLADVSSGLGVGMDRLVLAYGQIRSASFLRGQEVRQLTEAGIPILEELRKQFVALGEEGISVGDVFDKISTRLVPFEMVEKVFRNMTSEGGKFYKMQEIQAETLKGKISNLTDAYQIMFSEIGEKSDKTLKKSVDFVRSLAENYERVGRILLPLITAFGVYKATVISINAVMNAMKTAKVAEDFIKLAQSVGSVTAAFKTLDLATKTNIIGAIASALATIAVVATTSARATNQLNKELERISSAKFKDIKKEIDNFELLVDKLKKAEKGSKNYRDAVSALNSTYGDYLPRLLTEKDALDEIAVSEAKVVEAMKQRSREMFKQEALSQVDKTYADKYTSQISKIVDDIYSYRGVVPGSEQEKAITNWLQKFREKMETGLGDKSVWNAFKESYREFFGRDLFGAGMEEGPYFSSWEKPLKKAYELITQIKEAKDSIERKSDLYYGTSGFDSRAEQQGVQKIEESYNRAAEALKNASLSEREFNKQMKQLDINRLEELINLYTILGIKTDVLNSYKAQLQALTQVAEGWRGTVQKFFEKNEKYSIFQSVYGDKLDQKQSLEYVNDLVARYKELTENIKKYATTDMLAPQVAKMQEEKALIEGLARVLKIDLQSLIGAVKAESTGKDGKTFSEYMADWFVGDVDGEGMGYKISKILNTYDKAVFDIIKKSREAKEILEKDTEVDRAAGETQLQNVVDKAIANARINAQNGINDLANYFVNQFYFKENIDLQDWGDKTLAQIVQIKDKLKVGMSDESILDAIPRDIKERAEEAGLAMDVLISKIKEILGGAVDNVTVEELKKIVDTAKEVAESLRTLGNATGYEWMAEAADYLEMAIKGFTSAATGDWIGVVTTGLAAISKVMTYWSEKQAEIAENAMKYQKALNDIALQSYDTIFGTDDVGKLNETYRQLTDTIRNLKKESWDLNNLRLAKNIAKVGGMESFYGKDLLGWMGTDSEWLLASGAFTEFLNMLNDPSNIQVIKQWYAYLETNQEELTKHMSRSEKQNFNEFLEYLKQYTKVYAEWEKGIADIFGTLADDIVNNMLEAFDEIGDAVGNLDSAFYNLGESILKSLMKSFIIEKVLNEYKDQLFALEARFATNNISAEELAKELGNIADSMKERLKGFGDFFNGLIKAMQDAGLYKIASSENSSDSLANGIKSITEDTANLLASYVNAIRADVSATRATTSEISNDVKAILGLMPEVPNMAFYLAQIESHTAGMYSMMAQAFSTENGEPAFRTQNI